MAVRPKAHRTSDQEHREGVPSLEAMLTREEWERIVRRLHLSPREADVLRFAFSDSRVVTIAHRMGVSPNTVHTYRDRLFRRLGVTSMVQALALLTLTTVVVIREEAIRRQEM